MTAATLHRVKLRRLLTLGKVGQDVVAVKTALRAWKRSSISNTTPLYGEGAVAAVAAFQKAHRLTVDGVFGQQTLDKLAPHFSTRARKLYETPPAAKLVQPIPARFETGHNAIHETLGLPGYPASDFFADAGSPIVAMEDSYVERFSGHDPALGPISGPHGPLGWSVYLRGHRSGTDYYMTHFGTRTTRVGATVDQGQKIGTVADYARYGTPSHTHVGASGGLVAIGDLMAAPFA